jgi:outer membrane protein OmpA-like peptidoglycan-associated protein
MTPVVRAYALSLTAAIGAVGLGASGAAAEPAVQVDASVLDDLGPARTGVDPIVLKPLPSENVATSAKADGTKAALDAAKAPDTATLSKATPAAAPRAETAPSPPAVRPTTVAATAPVLAPARKIEPERRPATPASVTTVAPPAPAVGANSIVFAKGSSDLPGAADRTLGPLVKALAADPAALLAVNAYAAGGEDGDQSARRLALSRGLAVRRYLEAHGIAGARALVDARGAAPGGPVDRVDLAIAKN